ncbi:16S rRNA (cytosine(967)-C(5))-methyltransferase [Gilliamella apicola]|uniref:16S rRNA (cytosine(967)-C(5))-methyltransferase RsmB n=1 Tax=Gilliamella apicola TaxID=1196095 RepID=UPI000A335BB8|nr:16S rRNA (cytosine(967)-C(5))-methyltransferase RsmB [Gilliamella apicola]OTP90842.1 16S rRNA (cytosine(967)-C(5))-methyltransferase [Gilliamella apicola]OTP94158.1 16S rRNA (cytosine(967)-C(5))-methyltransferase [Gilliamella apicola]OTP95291.1 16S rRNA (cytosine(967)-C(5))-methyltransferase [Gilliamella apicola]OTQ02983.1 16S rRNA (cytosine(967)-C(5))-methyltransferase [Gilliamella apicola]OTQ06499.1 16S rRNA (cytosine(967)-C(5))-methyltransferase [Gilliamella apicola]
MNKKLHSNIRAICAQAIFNVLEDGQSLSTALTLSSHKIAEKDRALVQEICFGVMRVLPELNFYIHTLMSKVLTGKNRVLHYLLLVGIYQILYTRIPEHAAVGETVNAVNDLKKSALKGLVNGVLREFLRQQASIQQKFIQDNKQQTSQTLHPSWLLNRLKQAYPQQWQNIINANNQKPPMWLRVNLNHYSVSEYQQLLAEQQIDSEAFADLPCAIRLLSPVNVTKLPYFAEGAVTVQDLSAQYAAYLLAPKNGEQILDMCAAPGGKTTHILEIAPKANLLAVDVDASRAKRIEENLARLKQVAEVKVGDGLTPEKWCSGRQFDRILLDSPCSATGVIRRHPDIKWLRRDSDIAQLTELQHAILTNIWSYLKTDGTLVYATCSILPDENKLQIERFLKENSNAQLVGDMKQFLPTAQGGDGFFYAVLKKSS